MHPRPIFRLLALGLATLILALATGAPSHHHERSDLGPRLVDAGHHGHGVQLVDQDDRLTSQTLDVALGPPPTIEIGEEAATIIVEFVAPSQPVARSRPPPSYRPRAPPTSV
jgi:hypothetical protein